MKLAPQLCGLVRLFQHRWGCCVLASYGTSPWSYIYVQVSGRGAHFTGTWGYSGLKGHFTPVRCATVSTKVEKTYKRVYGFDQSVIPYKITEFYTTMKQWIYIYPCIPSLKSSCSSLEIIFKNRHKNHFEQTICHTIILTNETRIHDERFAKYTVAVTLATVTLG